jgi:hypothetical protein
MDCCIAGYFDVVPLTIVSTEFFTRHELLTLLAAHFVDDHMKISLYGVDIYEYSGGLPRVVDDDI